MNADQEPWATLGDTDGKNGAPRHFENQHAIDEEKANFESLVETDEDYYDIASRRMAGINAPSFKQALGSSLGIPIAILGSMFIDDNGNPITGLTEQVAALDINNDNVINYEDQPKDSEALKKFKNNIEIAKNHILENKDVGLPIMADYYTQLKVTAYNENYNKQEEARNKRNRAAAGGGGTGGGTGKIDLGVSQLVDAEGNPSKQRLYADRVDVVAKYNQIANAKSGDDIEGWDGKKTYQYQFHVPKSGKGFWLYQVWDSDRQQFVTKGGAEEAAGGGEGVKHFSTNQVIGELIPQTMLTGGASVPKAR